MQVAGQVRKQEALGVSMKRKLALLALCLGATGWVQAAPVAADAGAQQQVLAQAGKDLQNGKGQAAYDALLPLESQLAGTPDFDNLFGQAALAVHEDTRAAMAFERCLAVMPNNGNCRLGMAQAYLHLDEKQSAHDELVAIQQSAPPPVIEQAVKRYLGELSGTSQARQYFHAWVELALGYDNNTNVAPSTSTITLPGSSGIAGTFSSSTDSSAFDQASVGMSLQAPVTQNWSFLAGLNAQGTSNFQVADNSYFDSVAQVGGYLGTSARYGKQRFGLLAQAQNYQLGGESYRNLAGLMGQYSYQLSPATQVSGFVQRSRFDYQYGAGADFQNVDSTSAGVSVAQSLMQNQLVAFGGIYFGSDEKVESAASDNVGSDYTGLRGGVTWFFREGWQAGSTLLLENRKYGGSDYAVTPLNVYDHARKDNLASLDLSLAWQLSKEFSLRSQYSFVHNDSNIPVREYNRQIVSLGVRYDFL